MASEPRRLPEPPTVIRPEREWLSRDIGTRRSPPPPGTGAPPALGGFPRVAGSSGCLRTGTPPTSNLPGRTGAPPFPSGPVRPFSGWEKPRQSFLSSCLFPSAFSPGPHPPPHPAILGGVYRGQGLGRKEQNPKQRSGSGWAARMGTFPSGDSGPRRRYEAIAQTHSSVLAWRIPRTAEPGGLLPMGSHRVGHD